MLLFLMLLVRRSRKMPWKDSADAQRHNKAAKGKKAKIWLRIANQQLEEHGDEARAIKVANAAIRRMK
jgi:hypothetical protein